jgi:BirA family biotin operon repressor/biotin-[acetyl-CoA-carboxylase] ligase
VNEWPDGVQVAHHQTLDSTNEEARRLAAAGTTGPLWITAREQTQGRGRRGRGWVSTSGNLFATLLLQPAQPPETHAQLSFAAALAVGETVSTQAKSVPVSLKWPNDVLLNRRKVAGLLLEALPQQALAIGIGINLMHSPDGTEFPATSIKHETGVAPAPDAVLRLLAARMHAWYEIWMEQGFAPVKDSWMARAHGVGDPITARLHDGQRNGVFLGLDADGALILKGADGASTRLTAGEMFFRD